jgi:beta-phosphoglucomutase-like phosphatase (HAD superfamily)
MAEAIEGVIFDLDGTVLDTERFFLAAWREVLRKRGYAASEETAYRLVGVNEAAERAILYDEFGASYPYDEIRDELWILFEEKAERDGIAVKKGFGELLECIRKRSLPYALATSTGYEVIDWKLRQAGLDEVFPLIVCGNEVENGKPAPDIFLAAARLMGKAPEDCIGIEDSPAGLRGLHSAGIRSVFIKDIITPTDDVMAGVWRECRDLGEVCPLLGDCRASPRFAASRI